MGNRLIHIYDSHMWLSQRSEGPLSHAICRQKLSETEIFQLFIKPNNFRNRAGFHLRVGEEPLEVDLPHYQCSSVYRERTHEMLDLRLLATSSEIRVQATKLIYLTNTFSFEKLNILRGWLQMVPPHLLAYVQHLNIEMPLVRFTKGHPAGLPFDTAGWTTFFSADINAQLPRLKSLSLAVLLDGLVTCWRNTARGEFMNTFRPLRQLKHLRAFTIVINENKKHERGRHGLCADQTHDQAPRYTFWERKELRRVWAEEIREMILGERRDYERQPCVRA